MRRSALAHFPGATTRCAVAVALALGASGCVTLRATVGPTTDFDREAGVEVLGTVGLGFQTGEHSTGMFTVNVGGGLFPETPATRAQGEEGPRGCLIDELGLDHVWLPGELPLIVRGGVRGGFRAVFDDGGEPVDGGEPTASTVGSFGGAVAILPTLSSSTSETADDTRVGLGPEVAVDYTVGPAGLSRPHGRIGLVLELETMADEFW